MGFSVSFVVDILVMLTPSICFGLKLTPVKLLMKSCASAKARYWLMWHIVSYVRLLTRAGGKTKETPLTDLCPPVSDLEFFCEFLLLGALPTDA